MKLKKRELRQLHKSLDDLDTNLDVLDDTFGFSSLDDDQPFEGVYGTLIDMRKLVKEIYDILDDEPTDEE